MDVLLLGHTIMKRRKNLGITQSDLAKLAGVNINTLMKLEKGKANPTLEILTKIAGILGMELNLEVIRKP